MNSIKIDLKSCTSCKTCVNACFVDVLRWDEDGKKPVVAYEGDCVGCNACEMICPAKCITVVYGEQEHIPIYY